MTTSRFRQNITLVASANVAAHGLSLALMPVFTRLYQPGDFASMAAINTVAAIPIAIAALRFDRLIPRPRLEAQGRAMLMLALCALGVVCLVTGVLAVFLPGWLPPHSSFVLLSDYPILIPILALGGGIHLVAQAWFVRQGDLGPTARIKVTQSIIGAVVTLGGGLIKLGAAGLVLGTLVSTWSGIGLIWRQLSGTARRCLRLSRRPTYLAATLKRYAGEALSSSGVAIVNTAGQSAPSLWIALHFSATEFGLFALMQRAAIVPMGLFTSALTQAFWAEAAQLVQTDPRRLRHLYLVCSGRLALLSIPVALCCLLAPWYVGPLLGRAHWQGAGHVLAALTPLVIGQITVSSILHLDVHGKHHWQLAWDVVRLGAVFGSLALARELNLEFLPSLTLFSFTMLVMYAAAFALNLLALQGSINRHSK